MALEYSSSLYIINATLTNIVGKITFGKHLKLFCICFSILGLFQVSLDVIHVLKIFKGSLE